MTPAVFKKKVWQYYHDHGRHDLPWRKKINPYRILVSEIMLQQTQVDRVIPKYNLFLKTFPTVQSLAQASVADVLKLWSGLGYNRRALYLKRTAEAVVSEHKGVFPRDVAVLESLPGIGPYTARAVATFAYNQSYTFIETNIRTVFLGAFFPDTKDVHDKELLPYITKTLDREHSRDWYYALMDYGAHIKKTKGNISRKSRQYTKQSKFQGSRRQVRGAILKLLTKEGSMTRTAIVRAISDPDNRVMSVLDDLIREGFVILEKGKISLVY